jgi:hypothetical protein
MAYLHCHTEADQDSIDIVMAYLQDRLSMLPWLLVGRSTTVLHNNQLDIGVRYERPMVVPKKSWYNVGYITASWSDPTNIIYIGPSGHEEFSAHDPNVLDKIVQFLEKKLNKGRALKE